MIELALARFVASAALRMTAGPSTVRLVVLIAEMFAQGIIGRDQVRTFVRIKVAECGCQTLAAMLSRCTDERPKGILRTSSLRDIALAAQDDMGMRKARPDHSAVVKPIVERHPRDRNCRITMSLKSLLDAL